MTKEEIIKELYELKNERLDDLMKINVKHNMLVEFIAEINHIIEQAEKENNDG